ncbi:RNA polymerase sigma-70 factor [Paludibacter sp.]|uniref:RNA polymerase sigma-70 factor n=1 Tax=Paludibacter sp. TaxID=1898105 RepID=UPI001355F1FB|nr:RNA polymerase sigma-70 factor [Paludibacter sp.]MTK54622.1 RNA polymerase sigma-70 factor [Paludibacter sp.]
MINTEKNFADRLRSDDKKVIDEIFALYHIKIFRFSVSYLKNEDDAYDIVQEVFIKIWEARFSLKSDTNFDAFIFTIAKNAVMSLFRKRLSEQKYLDYLSESAVSNALDTEEQTDYVFLRQKYEQLVETLPVKRKEIFLLSREKGLSNKEIALRQGVSEKTVEDHITKALTYLKKQLSNYGIWTLLFYFLFVE